MMGSKTSIINEPLKFIREYALIAPGARVVVGLSGGPDSVCLFHLLAGLREELGIELIAAHLNHKFRPGAAEEDAEYVRELCAEYGVPLTLREVDVPALARETGRTIEETGRDERYRLFADICANGVKGVKGTDNLTHCIIAVAHHADDQAETLLIRMLRGTGPSGLAGMSLARSDGAGHTIIRPLLYTSRAEIEDYVVAHDLHVRRDYTNDDPKYTRNKIRLELLPLMDECAGGTGLASRALGRLAMSAAQDAEFFSCEVDAFVKRGDGSVFTRESLAQLHPALRHRVITEVFRRIGLTQDIEAAHLEAASALLQSSAGGDRSIDFPHGYRFRMVYDKVRFEAPGAEPETKGDGSCVSSSIIFDADKLRDAGASPIWRTRKDGDYMRPRGMEGSKKLQDIFTDMKIPRSERDSILILASENEVLWIPGLRATRMYLPDETTRHTASFSPEEAITK